MKKHIIIAGASLIAFGASAQEKTMFVQTTDSVRVKEIMNATAPDDVNYKSVPRFALVGKDSKFYFGVGANVKLVGDFDWGHPIDNPNKFTTADIPMTINKGDGGKFQLSAAQSDFYLNFVGLPGTDNQIGIYLDVNFMAGNHSPALHHAYLKYRGITAGHTTSIFTDMGSKPASIDYQGPNGLTFMGHPNISYAHPFGKDKAWSAAVGLDMPEFSGTYNEKTSLVSQRLPDIPVYLQRSWLDGKGYLRASAIFRTLTYHGNTVDKNSNVFGWGVKLSGRTPIVGGLSAKWQAVYGKGVSSYIQDMSGLGMDLMPDPNDASKLETIKSWGAYGTLRYDFCPKFFMNVTYSHVRAYAEHYTGEGMLTGGKSTTWGEQYKYAQYLTANCFWNINSFTQFGVEYLYGRRVNNSGAQAHDNRLSLMLMLSI